MLMVQQQAAQVCLELEGSLGIHSGGKIRNTLAELWEIYKCLQCPRLLETYQKVLIHSVLGSQ